MTVWCWIGAHIPMLTFVVLSLTLGAVVAYTRAAFQQAEGLVKPCLVPGFHAQKLGQRAGGQFGELVVDEFAQPTLVLRNIGTGPALNVRYEISEVTDALNWKLKNPDPESPIEAGGMGLTRKWKALVPDPAVFLAQYESVTGKKYESHGVIRGRLAWGQS